MARVIGISQFYLHTPRSSATEWTIPAFSFPAKLVLIYRPRGMEGWVGLGGWLHTEVNVRHREWTRRLPISVLTGPDVG